MTLDSKKHPDTDQIRDYLLGKLPAAALDDVAVHIDHCPECEETIAALDAVSDTVVAQIAAVKPVTESAPPESDVLRDALQRVMEFGKTAHTGDQTPSPAVSSAGAGERIGVYQLLEKLGEGGMGAVYKARHTKLDKIVAIKILPRDKTRSPQTVSRFEREMRAVGKLDHSHIVRALDAGEVDGTHFLVMEFVEGVDLGALVKERGPLPIPVACELIRQAAIGLQYAFEHEMVHRDIKPSNLMLTRSGEVKVLDLGLALLADAPDGGELTSTGQIMGTIDYMAPEQLESSHTVDTRADVFGLGATLYKLLTGEAPFVSPAHETLMAKLLAVTSGKHTPLHVKRSDVPPELSRLVDQMLAKNPAQRLPTPDAVAEGLAPLAEGADLTALTGGARAKTSGTRSSVTARPATKTALAKPTATVIAPQTAGDVSPPYRRTMVLCGGLGAAAAILLTIFLIIRDKDGKETAKIELKDGDKLEVVDQTRKENPAPPVQRPEDAKPVASVTPTIKPDFEKFVERVAPTTPADDPSPFWIVRKLADGKAAKPTKFATFGRAMQSMTADGVLEIHGTGPFVVSPVRIEQPSLTIRAAPGYRPQIDAHMQNASLLTMVNGELHVEGCDFRLPQGNFGSFIAGSGSEWAFSNCRFLNAGSFSSILDYTGPRLKFTDCMVVMGAAWDYPDQWLTLRSKDGKDVDFELRNCIIRVGGKSFIPAVTDAKLRVALTNNTFSGSPMLLPTLKDVKTDIEVTAHGNIFQLNEANGNAIHPAAYDWWKDKLRWHGSDNLYAGGKMGLARVRDNDWQNAKVGLAGFATFAGRDEKNATEAPAIYPLYRAPYAASEPTELVTAYKQTTTLPREVKGFEQPGPDWTLVGPGEAYVRSLAANGSKTAELRPRPFSGGVFVLKHENQIKHGYDRLNLAFDAAEDGDTIEIRTDDDTEGFVFITTKKLKSLTVKAAPGYSPVITGMADWVLTGMTLNVEGLTFRGGHVRCMNVDQEHPAAVGMSANFVNCAFTQPLKESWGASPSIGNTFNFLPITAGNVLTIRNCVVTGGIHAVMNQGGRLEIRNSATGALNLFEAGKGSDWPQVQVERSVMYCPAIYSDPYVLITLRASDPKVPARFQFKIRDSWLENSIALLRCGENCGVESWSGAKNVFAVGQEEWYAGPEKNAAPVTSLGAWRQRWNSDNDSLAVESGVYDPRQWKLMPDTPGAGQRPDGKDLGADVSRIAIVPAEKAK